MNNAKVDELPEELLLLVFTYLDSAAPSELKARQEPEVDLTASDVRDLKNVSAVSKTWRRVVLPLLFRHVALRLDSPSRRHWSDCSVCGFRGTSAKPGRMSRDLSLQNYHSPMITEAGSNSIRSQLAEVLSEHDDESRKSRWVLECTSTELTTKVWTVRFYHSLVDFLHFVEGNELGSSIQSFTLLTSSMLGSGALSDRFPHTMANTVDWRYRASAAFWQHLFSSINPTKVAIVAPPLDLACLTLCSIDAFGDWAFGDMEYHTLTLERNPLDGAQLCSIPEYSSLYFAPESYPGVASSSLLNLHQWTHVSLNEGCFLKAYGTYEYFERGPPSLIYSIKDSLGYVSSDHSRPGLRPPLKCLSALTSFTYTAIFPFANHLDLNGFLPYIERLDLQLAPDPQSGILDDKDRTGKAELQDCWTEMMGVYHTLARRLATHRISATNCPRLQQFTCRDFRIADLRAELDDLFVLLCLPVWVEYEPGVFTRQEMSIPSIEDHGGVS